MRSLAVLIAFALVAGCASPPPEGGSSDDGDGGASEGPGDGGADAGGMGDDGSGGRVGGVMEAFDAITVLPAGWTADAGTWTVEANASAASGPHVLRGVGGGGRSTLMPPVVFADFEATMRFQMVAGDEGVGISFRYTEGGDYRIVRYSIREAGWHYFIMKNGTSDKPEAAVVAQTQSAPALGEWVTLRVVAEGKRVQAWHDQTRVIDFTETEEPQAGAVGPFIRGEAVALFDDLHVRPIGTY